MPAVVSQASLFFDSLSADNDAAYQKLASMVVGEPQLEAEWIDYKSGRATHDDVRRHWGKALSGFSNSSGGIIIWGIATKKAGALDVPSHLELVADAVALEGRLHQLVNTAADPPVLGSRIRRVIEPGGNGRGFVIALIPASDLAPHRDEESKIFYVRAGDQHHPARAGLLRQLFYPHVVPVVRLDSQKIADRVFIFSIENSGAGTAKDLFLGAIDRGQCVVVKECSAVKHLCNDEPNPILHHLFLEKPLHPMMAIFVATAHFHCDAELELHVFASDMPPVMWRAVYSRNDDALKLEGPRPMKLREKPADDPAF